MPRRITPLVTDHYYHIFNRGVERRITFLDRRDYLMAIFGLRYYCFADVPMKLSLFNSMNEKEREGLSQRLKNNHPKLVDIISFALMPNHFHLLLHQRADDGVATLLRKWQNSYTRYFNTRHERSGPLFQGAFKAVHIDSSEQLLHVSRYIHLNPVVSAVVTEDRLEEYSWSSYPDFRQGQSEFLNLTPILEHFQDINSYKQFVVDQIDYAKQLEAIKHLILE